jgi:hypothetical protein
MLSKFISTFLFVGLFSATIPVSVRAQSAAPVNPPSLSATPAKKTSVATKAGQSIEKLFKESKRLFYKDDFDGSLTALKQYFGKLLSVKKEKQRTQLRFGAIVAMGRIYLQDKQDPKGAIEWFEKIQKTQTLTEAEHDIISGWIAGSRDWIKLGKFPKDLTEEKALYDLGKQYYDSGLKKQKFPMDPAGAADLSIASTYLVPFLVHFDKSAQVGEVLFMMGDIRRRLWTDNEYWSKDLYLTEAIRRFPGTPVAQKSFTALEEDVHFGYSGSGGDNTHHSWVVLLGELKKVANGTVPASTLPVTSDPKTVQ